MRFYEIIIESKVGRNLQHLEDLVFIEGSSGSLRALNILERLANDAKDVTIKWDGTPAVIFGRDEYGNFILTDIAGLNAKRYNGRVTSPEELEAMLLNRSNREIDDKRKAFAANMRKIWNDFESAVPKDFRGFIHGDLLYYSRPPIKNGYFVFKPNKVTYYVRADSDYGKRIAKSNSGVVIHTYTTLDGDVKKANPKMLNEGKLFIMPPIVVQHPPKINKTKINQLRNYIKKNADIIDRLVEPKPGLSDIRNIIYSYVNHMSKTRQWDNLPNGFENWLMNNSKVSKNKKQKIINSPNFNQFPVLFDIVLKIQALKDDIIDQFDNQGFDIIAKIDGQRGGEGYVVSRDKVKLVPRRKWVIG